MSMHARTTTSASPPNASSDKATADDAPDNQMPIPSPTFSFNRNDYQATATPNSAPDTLKNFPMNKALIDAVNNTFLEMYESYTGKARMTGSGDSKRLIIHFQTMKARDACVGAAHLQFPDLIFHAHNSRQLRSNEDLWAIQVTDIPFFLTKENVISYFKKFDQKSSRRAFVATLTQLPSNTKDIDLAPLIRELGAKAVNVPLSLNSYKPKRWAYITFPSQELMDALWNNSSAIKCPLHQQRGRTRDRNPVAALKERFHVGQPSRLKTSLRSRSRSKGPDNSGSSQHQQSSSAKSKANTLSNHCNHSKSNDKCDRSVSFSSALRTPPLSSARIHPSSLYSQEASEILSLLKALQQDMADVRDRITATTQSSDMNIDQPDVSTSSLTHDSLHAKPPSRPLNPLLPDFVSLVSHVLPTRTSSPAAITPPAALPFLNNATAKIQAINEKHSAIKSKMDMLVASISGFIGSINTPSTTNSANTASSN
ncbi:hypothetical protein RclHR1_06260016 [Rhizophagus clarus]|uniref:RRM domain-containing protein n=1 Tax=Rhizophagus clarus TaxID=94130 RepID=A0A2Z6S866_9GLOM|nr:hypothetical protein RclHR1_06260016 [Rhizophagus clarus]